MSLSQVAATTQFGLGLWLLALAVLVVWRMLTDGRMMQGLLSTRVGVAGFEPDRLQLVVAYLIGVGGFLLDCAAALRSPDLEAVMPDVSENLLTLLAASQAVYLGGKIARLRPKGG